MRTNRKGRTISPRHYLVIVSLSVALLIVPFGCAHRPKVKAPPLPKFTEAELGTIAVVSACFEPGFEGSRKPMTKGKAAGMGALAGLALILAGGAAGGGIGGAPAVALSPVVAVGGAIYGAIEGETAKTIRKTEKVLNDCLTDLRPQEVIRERVLSLARERSRYTFVVQDQCGPNVLDEETTYSSLKGKAIDTVLQISIRKIDLWGGKGGVDPPLSLFVTVSTRLIRVKDDTVLSTDRLTYKSQEKQKFTKWAKNDAQPFRDELDRCFGNLAERIVTELFIN